MDNKIITELAFDIKAEIRTLNQEMLYRGTRDLYEFNDTETAIIRGKISMGEWVLKKLDLLIDEEEAEIKQLICDLIDAHEFFTYDDNDFTDYDKMARTLHEIGYRRNIDRPKKGGAE